MNNWLTIPGLVVASLGFMVALAEVFPILLRSVRRSALARDRSKPFSKKKKKKKKKVKKKRRLSRISIEGAHGKSIIIEGHLTDGLISDEETARELANAIGEVIESEKEEGRQ